ncbi:MAG: DNA polymerase III subunit delta [Chloroflexota bacterium]|nr:DNA polymerase III subunit delta [Chloroflexota bacterium]MDE2940902.1 DNA polymerase III subunit delta [Chloroflexota bacterium]MDE3268397.1 DNA polymerase III subunit delta [Chloroflexota bacterium]
MLHILYGADDFSSNEALEVLKSQVGPPDVLDANVTRGPASAFTPQQVQALCSTVPFLADRRLVIVDGLLSLFEGRRTSRRGRGTRDAASDWLALADFVPDMPPSTDLVLVDGAIGRGNALLASLSPLGQATEFPALRGPRLNRWIQDRAAASGCAISGEGVRLLSELVGGNLWTLSSEIEKLSLYCNERTVDADDVRLLVPFANEVNVFNAVDAMMERRYPDALRAMRRLMDGGATGTYIVAMVARQVRLLLLTKDLEASGVPQSQMGSRMGVASDWVLGKLREQASRFSAAGLETLHGGLLETDLAVKTGRITESSVAEHLVQQFTSVGRSARV